MDLYLGIPSVIMDPDKKRRSLYGKAGDFRLTPFGCEYRVLSSFMLGHTDFVYDQTMKAIEAFNQNKKLPNPDLVQMVINESLKEEAEVLMKKYNV